MSDTYYEMQWKLDNAGYLAPDPEGGGLTAYADQTWSIRYSWEDTFNASYQAFVRFDITNIPVGWTAIGGGLGFDPRVVQDYGYAKSLYVLTADYATLDTGDIFTPYTGAPTTGYDATETIDFSNISWYVHTFGDGVIAAINSHFDQTNKLAFMMRYDASDPETTYDSTIYVTDATGSCMLYLKLVPPIGTVYTNGDFFYSNEFYGVRQLPRSKDAVSPAEDSLF